MRNFIFLVVVFTAGGLTGWYARETLVPENSPLVAISGQSAQTTISDMPIKEPDKHQENWRSELVSLLKSGNYTAALELYEILMDVNDEKALVDARAQILNHASWLLARQQYSATRKLLQSFLVLAYRDVEARMLLAEAQLAEKDYRSAITHYYEAKGHAHRVEVIERLNRLIRSAVQSHATTLEQNINYSALLDLYQFLTQLEPDHAPYYIGLAKAQLALNDAVAARQSLQLVIQDAEVGSTARSILAQLLPVGGNEPEENRREESASVSRIPLHRRGHQYFVDSMFDGDQSIRLLIDTGASMTIITPAIVEQNSQSVRSTGKTGVFHTANGRVSAPIYRLDALTIGEWQVRDLEVGVLALGDQKGFDGLLGMNFLKHFQFFIDQDEGTLNLSPN
jgi:clan AA aspartic protease (TIGR02281 family)